MKTYNTYTLLLLFLLAQAQAFCQESNRSDLLTPFATGLITPVSIANADDSRLFIVDQHGIINIIDAGGTVLPQPFLDIHERVSYGGERGLLGLAFHPEFSSNGYFFVNYTGNGDSTRISRFSISRDNPDLADPESEMNLMTIFQPFSNHNGGDLNFGPDGYLYIGLGDGGSSGDPGNRAQNPMEYLGKMLRIDVDNGSPYAIPPTNPFNGSLNTLNEIWSLGLRNPWRFSFDRLTGDLWIADVGQNAFEEIDFQPASSAGGENYGWRCYEGYQPYNTAGCAASTEYTSPIHTYPHGEGCSVTGGYVYRGSTSSQYYGRYFFADYCSDRIWTLHSNGGVWLKEDFGQYTGNNFSTFGEDASGQLYIAGITSGIIYRIAADLTGMPDELSHQVKIIYDPLNGNLKIESFQDYSGEMKISLSDIKGMKLYSKISGERSVNVDTHMLPAGMYFIRVATGYKVLDYKFVKLN